MSQHEWNYLYTKRSSGVALLDYVFAESKLVARQVGIDNVIVLGEDAQALNRDLTHPIDWKINVRELFSKNSIAKEYLFKELLDTMPNDLQDYYLFRILDSFNLSTYPITLMDSSYIPSGSNNRKTVSYTHLTLPTKA